MIFLGDIHGDYTKIPKTDKEIIQVGDFGIGFAEPPNLPKNFKFIRGNHDNPELCRNYPLNYLGEWGTYRSLFYVSGAYSVDWQMRTPGLDWWPNEELSEESLDSMLRMWKNVTNNFVVSHDIPASIKEQLFGMDKRHSRTNYALDALLNIRQPDFWVFGHHHKSVKTKIGNTWFYGLGINEVWEF